jgi:O-acetyl-ADP-ribose deacetylase (regulator of RNase III)
MNIVTGNLIELAKAGEFDVIVHGCNCRCTMGTGIARSIKEAFPEAEIADNDTKNIRPEEKLGHLSHATVFLPTGKLHVVNAYTQLNYGRGLQVDYKAIESTFRLLKLWFGGQRIAYPLIGCGHGGGDWNIVSGIINKTLEGENHTLVVLNDSDILLNTSR